MLVIAWEAMNGVIVRLQAEANLSAYNVAVLATPTADRYALSSRERTIESWVKLTTPAKRVMEVSLGKLKDLLQGAFREGIRG